MINRKKVQKINYYTYIIHRLYLYIFAFMRENTLRNVIGFVL